VSGAAIPRYSIYFAPAVGSELAEFGRFVMSRQPIPDDHPDRIEVTSRAAHYGFHSTLKAPMELAESVTERDLLTSVEQFCQSRNSVPLTGLAPSVLDGFHALKVTESTELDQFAADVVTAFEPHRAPLTAADRARRNPDALSARQVEYLDTFGYPYVLNEFRFHMTLSYRIENAEVSSSYAAWLTDLFNDIVTEAPRIDRLAVFSQPDRDTAFTRVAEFPVN